MSHPVSLKQLSWHYGTQQVLKDITQEIRGGCFTAILGPNGSGKTTMLKLLMRMLKPEADHVTLDGEDILSYPRRELARRIGSVPQHSSREHPYKVYEMVLMGRYPHKGRFEAMSTSDHDIVRRALKTTEVYHLKNHSILEVSGGELQRVIISRALAQEPDILALDEPTSHLDPRHQLSILHLLKHLVSDRDITVMCVLHDLNSAMHFSDRVILLDQGRIAGYGHTEQVLTPEHIKRVYGVDTQVRRFDGDRPHILFIGS